MLSLDMYSKRLQCFSFELLLKASERRGYMSMWHSGTNEKQFPSFSSVSLLRDRRISRNVCVNFEISFLWVETKLHVNCHWAKTSKHYLLSCVDHGCLTWKVILQLSTIFLARRVDPNQITLVSWEDTVPSGFLDVLCWLYCGFMVVIAISSITSSIWSSQPDV